MIFVIFTFSGRLISFFSRTSKNDWKSFYFSNIKTYNNINRKERFSTSFVGEYRLEYIIHRLIVDHNLDISSRLLLERVEIVERLDLRRLRVEAHVVIVMVTRCDLEDLIRRCSCVAAVKLVFHHHVGVVCVEVVVRAELFLFWFLFLFDLCSCWYCRWNSFDVIRLVFFSVF